MTIQAPAFSRDVLIDFFQKTFQAKGLTKMAIGIVGQSIPDGLWSECADFLADMAALAQPGDQEHVSAALASRAGRQAFIEALLNHARSADSD